MDILVGLLVIVAGAATLAFFASPRTSLGLDLFAAGFLPYRDPGSGWPQGVQEEDPVAWTWHSSAAGEPGLPADDTAMTPGDGPELVEISHSAAPIASPVQHGRMGRGPATRVPGRRCRR